MGFSDAEVQAATERLVLTSISRPLDTLGVRRSDISFKNFIEAVSGVFLLYPTSPFYAVSLGTRRLEEQLGAEVTILDTLLSAISATGRRVLPVDDVTTLYNARSALQSLAQAASTRTQGFLDISKTPSHINFETQVKAFTDTNGPSIKQDGDIVSTPQEAKTALPELLRQLKETHLSVVLGAKLLSAAMSDYASVNLPSLVATSVLSRAAQVIGQDADTLNSISKEQRLEKVRGVILNLLAAKAAVRTFGSFKPPSPFLALEGVGIPFSDDSHLATPASILADSENTAVIIAGSNNTLTFTLDGGAPSSITLSPSTVASILGTGSETSGAPNGFLIGNGTLPTGMSGTTPPNNYEVKVRVRDNTGFDTTYTATLTLSSSITSFRTAIQVASEIQAALPAGIIAEDVLVGPTLKRIRIRCAGTYAQVSNEVSIAVVSNGVVTSPSMGSLATFGFVDGAVSSCQQTKLKDLAFDINSKKAGQLATHPFLPDFSDIPARSKITDPYLIVFSHSGGTGDASYVGPTLTLSNISYDRLGTVQVGDTIVLRSGPDLNTEWVIASVSSSTLIATGFSGTNTLGVSFEVGQDITAQKYDAVRIQKGVNANEYVVAGQGDTSLDVKLLTPLPVIKVGTVPVYFNADFGKTRLRISSTNQTLSSSILLAGSSITELFPFTSPTAVGTTPWFKLPSIPKGLQVGDILELYPSQYNVPSEQHAITSVEAQGLLEVSEDVGSMTSWTFGDVPVPFAKVRTGTLYDFEAFKSRLDAWLLSDTCTEAYFTNLNRLINPLLVGSNPTAEQVGEATNEVNRLYGLLTTKQAATLLLSETSTLQSTLASYVVSPVDPLTTTLRAYKEKGGTRATDILLSGQFSTFFGLSEEDVSYAGALQGSLRGIALNDLPVRKTNRLDARNTPIINSSSTTVDPEYDRGDVENAGKPENLGG